MRQGRLKGTLSSEGHAAKAAFQFLHPGRNAYRRCRLGDNGAACDKPERRAERGKTHERAREMNTHASLALTNRHGLSGLNSACRCRTHAQRRNARILKQMSARARRAQIRCIGGAQITLPRRQFLKLVAGDLVTLFHSSRDDETILTRTKPFPQTKNISGSKRLIRWSWIHERQRFP